MKRTKLKKKLKIWVSYWHANPHRFYEEVLGVKFGLFQKLLLWALIKIKNK